MGHTIYTVFIVTVLSSVGWTLNYKIEDSCVFQGLLDVAENSKVTVNGAGDTRPLPSPCEMIFRAATDDHILTVEVASMSFKCGVSLEIITTTTTTLTCQVPNPGKLFLNQRIVRIQLKKTNPSVIDYNFQLIITANKRIINPGVTDTQPVAVGLVIGIVGGVFALLIILAIVGTCCYRHTQKYKRNHPEYFDSRENQKRKLEEREPSHVSVGCTNSSASMNGLTYPEHESSPRAKTKLLHENENSVSNSRPKTLNFKGEEKKPLPPPYIENFAGSPKKSVNAFDFDDDDPYDKLGDDKPKPPKSPFLDALHKNPKFKATFDTTENEAEERRRRISSSSVSQQGVNASDASLDSAATPPKLPAVPTVPKSPGSKKKHASIKGRVPRPVSSSEEELGQRARTSDESDDAPPKSSKTVESHQNNSSKPDTRHTLKPDRGKSSKDKGRQFEKSNSKDRKLSDLPDALARIGNFEKNPSIRSSKSSRKSNKSPRLGAKNASRGFGHRRNRGDETDGSRPGTPTSVMDRDDLESLPPLERSASRQSLYASRSSLYRRRGRSRQNSFSESIASTYAHDDMEVNRHSRSYSRDRYDYSEDEFDGYERPINRKEKYKMFKSESDIGYDGKEKSTQTLRETATQTGQQESVITHPERIIRKKRRSKSLSAAGTQTSSGTKDTKTKDDTKKRTKSTASDKPKPKPKPKPRKSTEGDLNDNKNVSSSKENLADHEMGSNPQANQNADVDQTPTLNNPPVQGVPVYPGAMPQQGLVPPYMQYGVQPSAIPPHMMQPGMVAYNPAQIPPGAPGGMPYTSQGFPPPPPYQPTNTNTSGKPKKSNWELLCEMTDKQQNGPPSETGSLQNSVFMSNPPSNYGDPPHIVQPSQVGYYQPPHVQMLPMTVNYNMGVPSGPPSEGGVGSHGHRSGPSSLHGSDPGASLDNGAPQEQPVTLAKKSSWEALKDITDKQYKTSQGATHNESIV